MKFDLKKARQDLHKAKAAGLKLLETIQGSEEDATAEQLVELSAAEELVTQCAETVASAEREIELARTFEVDPNAQFSGGEDRILQDEMRGWESNGHFYRAVFLGARGNVTADPRLMYAAPTTVGVEGTGADGGFLVPPGIARGILSYSLEEDAFIALTDNDDVEGNGMTWPSDEDTPWGTSGIQAYWAGENVQGTQSKPDLKMFQQRLHKLFVLVPVTDELLADASAMGGYVTRKSGEKIRWKTNDAIINGTGAGQPKGVFTAPATVSQAKESGQAADTIVPLNVTKMFARNLNPGRAVWLINSDAWNQLPALVIGDQPVFLTPSGLTTALGGILLGRPVMMTETCQTLGDKGDIQFIDFGSYKTITKAGGIEQAQSMHLWFDYDVMAFRAIFRVDGAPWASAAVTPPNSAVTKSGFVQLDARA